MAHRILDGNSDMRRRLIVNLEQANVPARGRFDAGLSLIDMRLGTLHVSGARRRSL